MAPPGHFPEPDRRGAPAPGPQDRATHASGPVPREHGAGAWPWWHRRPQRSGSPDPEHCPRHSLACRVAVAPGSSPELAHGGSHAERQTQTVPAHAPRPGPLQLWVSLTRAPCRTWAWQGPSGVLVGLEGPARPWCSLARVRKAYEERPERGAGQCPLLALRAGLQAGTGRCHRIPARPGPKTVNCQNRFPGPHCAGAARWTPASSPEAERVRVAEPCGQPAV